MLGILYEDRDIIVVEKPIGMESQASSRFAPDMVSEIKKHINKLCPTGKEPYVGVIHRLDQPVGGVMVYAKTQKAAGALSKQVRENAMKKMYKAVVCGQLVDIVGNYVDYLLKDGKTNRSNIVEMGITGSKRAELNYRLVDSRVGEPEFWMPEEEGGWDGKTLSLVEVELVTGRHHQIRVQFAGHGTPLWGDNRYHPAFCGNNAGKRCSIALAACQLTFHHPVTGKSMTFSVEPQGAVFKQFNPKKD